MAGPGEVFSSNGFLLVRFQQLLYRGAACLGLAVHGLAWPVSAWHGMDFYLEET
jgi:hypothetical protein